MDIWCIGDLNYLAAVMNGLAMLSNNGLFTQLIKLGLILAVIIIALQASFQSGNAGGIPWGKFIVAFIAFKFLFGSVTTVYINDTYSLKTKTVDNVPYGVAVTGSILSKVAHEITLNLEQAFSLPSMTDTGFGGPLQTLTVGQQFYSGLSTLYNGNISKTLVEYCDKCTSTGINKGELDINNIKVAPDPWGAMKWESTIFYTTTWLPGDDQQKGNTLSCTAAWSAISDYLKGDLWTHWNKYLSAQICNEGEGTCDPVSTMQSALDSLAKDQEDAQNYMLSSVLLPAFEQGQINFNSFMGKPEMSIIVGQAREQRNIQWMSEGSLFMNIARPMMAFFEGFLYAITPFMALLVAFVPSGLSLVGKYIMMFVWVQLWMPILAILNQYTMMIAQNKLTVLIDGSIPLTSLQGNLMGCSAINDWLGVAGILVASTPAISLALLFGGAITMTHLAGRLKGGDFVNEKIARPDVVSPGAALSMAPGYSHDSTMGLRKTGAEAIAPMDEVSGMASHVVQSKSAQMTSATEGFREAIGSSFAHGTSGSVGTSQQSESGQSVNAGLAKQFGTNWAMAEAIGHDNNWSKADIDQLKSATGGSVSAGGSAGTPALFTAATGFSAKVAGEVHTKLDKTLGTEKANQVVDWMKSNLKVGTNQSVQSAIDDKMFTMYKAGQLSQYMDTSRQEDTRNLEKATQKLDQSQKEYSDAQQFASRIGTSHKINRLAEARFAAKGGMDESAEDYMARWRMPAGLVNQEAATAARSYGSSGEEAKWMGILGAAFKMAKQPGAEGEIGREMYLGVARKMGMQTPETGDPNKLSGIVDPGRLEQAGGHAAQSAQALPGPGQVGHKIEATRGSIPGVGGPEKVRNLHAGNLEGLIDKAAQQHGLDRNLLKAVIQQESDGNPNAVSPKGAMGLMQLMPDTARGLGVKNPFDPEENVNGGAKHLSGLLNKYGGNLRPGLMAYNGGEKRVDQGKEPVAETKGFFKGVMEKYKANVAQSQVQLSPPVTRR